MTEAYIGVGSNLGDREKNITSAIKALEASEGICISKVSQIYETDPVGGPPQDKYLNGVMKIETGLSARELLKRLLNIEDSLGRQRLVKNGPRTIDLDILTFGDLHIEEEGLVIPHPRMNERDIVKIPMAEL